MATADDKIPARPVNRRLLGGDPGRHPIRESLEERQRRRALAPEIVARMRAIENGPDEDDRDFFRALDESNPGRFNLKRFYEDGPDPA